MSLLLLTPPGPAAADVVIEDIGLQGLVLNWTTRVRVGVTNPSPDPQTVELRLAAGAAGPAASAGHGSRTLW